MITLTLLHPVQFTPIQSWAFEQESVIRIGRASDNHVVLYSAVVSRYHVELRHTRISWEIVNLGTNGTYLDGRRVQQATLVDGGVIRLARSGPNIRVKIGDPEFSVKNKMQTQSNEESQNFPSIKETEVILESPLQQHEGPVEQDEPLFYASSI